MSRFRRQTGAPPQPQPLKVGAPVPLMLRTVGAGLMGGLGGVLLDLLAGKGGYPKKTPDRLEP